MKIKKIAIVHDQLQEFGGAEQVLVSLKNIFPQADVFTSFFDLKKLGVHQNKFYSWQIQSSFFDKIPLMRKFYSPLRFITPWIWESFNFSNYDLVISSSGSYMSKGIITKPETIHICYLHHPPRYLYFYETAVEWQKYWPIRVYTHLINHCLRQWDYISSQRVDYFIANSYETRSRIRKFYQREAEVIYPPVKITKNYETLNLYQQPKDYYLTVSRLSRAKHIEILIKAANKLKLNLKIVGVGRDQKYLMSKAGKTVEFLGSINDQELSKIYQKAKVFLFAAIDEEFGIAPVEAMGYGLPVIAFKSGGVPEYLLEGKNGFLFNKLSEDSLIEKIKLFENLSTGKIFELKRFACQTAENFSEEKFKERLLKFISNKTRFK